MSKINMNYEMVKRQVQQGIAALELLCKEYGYHETHLKQQIDWKDANAAKAHKMWDDIYIKCKAQVQKQKQILKEIENTANQAERYLRGK